MSFMMVANQCDQMITLFVQLLAMKFAQKVYKSRKTILPNTE